jgi:TetR/AcrR family transcriptional regulator, repressor for uid operon
MSSQIAPLLIRALTSTEEEHDDPLAQRILDATVVEAASSGLGGLSVDDVARRADTTRMTVYRRFGRREQLIEAMASRETRRFIAAIGTAIAAFGTIEDQGAEAFVVGLRFMHSHPFARRAIESEPEGIIALLEAENGLIFAMGRDFIADGLRAGGAEHAHLVQAAETLARIFVSFLLMPRSVVALDDESAAHAYVRDCVAPIITRSVRLDLTDGAAA